MEKTTAANVGLGLLRNAELDFLLASDTATPQKFMADRQTRFPPDYDELTLEVRELIDKRLAFAGQCGWHYEEFGGHLRQMTRRDSPYWEFHSLLRRMDDTPPHITSATISRGTTRVERPYLALLGNLTYADRRPFASKSDAMWSDGFWARFTFIAVPPGATPNYERFPDGERVYPDDLKGSIRKWHERLRVPEVEVEEVLGRDEKPTGERRVMVTPTDPHIVELTADVKDLFYAYDEALGQIIEAGATDTLNASYSRLPMRALRLAALFASFAGRDQIGRGHWGRAQSIVERWREGLHAVYAHMDTPRDDTKRKMDTEAKVIARIWEKGRMNTREVVRMLHRPTAETRELVHALERAGDLIHADEEVKGGRIVTFWMTPGKDDEDG